MDYFVMDKEYFSLKCKMQSLILLYWTLQLSTATLTNLFPQELINIVNSKNTSWKAGLNFKPDANTTVLKRLAGTRLDDYNYELMKSSNKTYPEKIPLGFDARIEWPNCTSIREIANQGACKSCWAVAAVSAMTDRYCIHSGAKYFNKYSAADLITCCISAGCAGGGYVSYAWQYWFHFGIVSGGVYNSSDGCLPYLLPPCTERGCGNEKPTIPFCKHVCRKGYFKTYKKDKKFAHQVYAIKGGENEIKGEIFTNGPVEAAFLMFEDFLFYKTGVYRHVAGRLVGGHAVKLLGWGIENGHKYWLAANSWGAHWGDNGFFKIARGKNECGIQSLVVAGIPKVDYSVNATRSRLDFNILEKFDIEISW